MSHMSPETQLQKRVTKASDVFSFGITLWELFTGSKAYEGVPIVLLSHRVCVERRRPEFPESTPAAYRALAESCWAQEPEQRCAHGRRWGGAKRGPRQHPEPPPPAMTRQ